MEEGEDLGVARKCLLVDGWIVGYVEFPMLKSLGNKRAFK